MPNYAFGCLLWRLLWLVFWLVFWLFLLLLLDSIVRLNGIAMTKILSRGTMVVWLVCKLSGRELELLSHRWRTLWWSRLGHRLTCERILLAWGLFSWTWPIWVGSQRVQQTSAKKRVADEFVGVCGGDIGIWNFKVSRISLVGFVSLKYASSIIVGE
jgi:hypothetical protein